MIINSSVNGTATIAYLVSADQLAAKVFSIRVLSRFASRYQSGSGVWVEQRSMGRIIYCIAGVFIPSSAFYLSTKRAG